jgi:hypothetical protein
MRDEMRWYEMSMFMVWYGMVWDDETKIKDVGKDSR